MPSGLGFVDRIIIIIIIRLARLGYLIAKKYINYNNFCPFLPYPAKRE